MNAKEPFGKDLVVEVESGNVPMAETCEGPEYSPEVRIRGLYAPYIALLMEDNSSTGGKTHWLLWNVPGTEVIPRNLAKQGEVERPLKGIQGRNDFDVVGYSGPCPPVGEEHKYVFRVYGLDAPLDLNPSSIRKDFEDALTGHVVQYGQAEVTYRRKQESREVMLSP